MELASLFNDLAQRQKQTEGTSDYESFDILLEEIRQEAEEREGDDVEVPPLLKHYVSTLVDSEELSHRWASAIVRAHSTLNELVLIDKRTETAVRHHDVGIGISQVLPVLVSCYGLQNQIIAIEQPEIHLHPALQAELGDVFIRSAIGDNKNTFILETHSEHLILRIMRRIRDTNEDRLPPSIPAVRPGDVSVLFVEPTNSGAVVRVLELDMDGAFIDPWPGGFFEEGFVERFT
jgi:predicted ATPase